MNAFPLLSRIAKLLNKHKLEVVMIGNAAAALQGAPVTTVDIDFMFRDTPQNLAKLKALARELEAVILRPYYPASKLYRVTRDRADVQLDFMPVVHGIRSFASLRSRADTVNINGFNLLVADLNDIIKSKRSAGRERDRAVLSILEKTLSEKTLNEKKLEEKTKILSSRPAKRSKKRE